jgi:hypothetical protein
MRISHATPCCAFDSVLPPSTIQLRHVTPPHAHSAAAAAPPPMADPHPHLDSNVAPPPPQPPSAADAAPAAPPPSQPSPAFELSQIPEECARPSSPSARPAAPILPRPPQTNPPSNPLSFALRFRLSHPNPAGRGPRPKTSLHLPPIQGRFRGQQGAGPPAVGCWGSHTLNETITEQEA